MDKINVVFFTGAGISAESGIPTFRDSDGLWEGHDVMSVASIESWKSKINRDAKRELMLNFYNQRRRDLEHVEPNAAHRAISAFEMSDKFTVNVITQNVDNLHERAGSCKVLHLHGELTKARSTYYDGKSDHLRKSIDIGYNDIKLGDKCPDTGSQLRPDIVWFGEDVPMMGEAFRIIKDADVVVIVGTSLQVYPAAHVLDCVFTDNVIIVNPVIQDRFKDKYICFQDKASTGVKQAIDYIINKFQ